MKCFFCVVAWQARETERIDDAVVMYAGNSLCMAHLNSMRGWPHDPEWRHDDVLLR